MKNPDLYKTQILKWTCIGLLIRLTLMPFTMHGQDLFFINYFPMKFVTEGIWDPYTFISRKFAHFIYTYYGPAQFAIMTVANFIMIKLFNAASLIKILELASTMMFGQLNFAYPDYIYAFLKVGLFKNLFLMKSPYLVFDFLIGAILLRAALSKKLALASYKFWMLNIVVLHTAYMVGQFDLIPAFFIVAALYAGLKQRPYLAVVLLSLGGATKLLPYVFVLPACLLLADNWKKRSFLLLTDGFISILLYLPFYLSSADFLIRFFAVSQDVQYTGMAKWILDGVFVFLYALVSISAIKDSAGPNPEKKLLRYFLVIGFLICAAIPIAFRYFVFLTPLLALIMPQHRKFAVFMLLSILILAFLRLDNRYVQMALFAPLNPEYFVNLPTIQKIVGRFINIEIVYKLLARISLLSFFIAAGWVWGLKKQEGEKR